MDNDYKKIKHAIKEIHQDRIDTIEGQDMERLARGQANHLGMLGNPSMASLEGLRPRGKSSPQGLLENQQQYFNLGRVNTTTSEENIGWLGQRSPKQLLSPDEMRRSPDRMHRASTTTLGTVASGSSQNSRGSTSSRAPVEDEARKRSASHGHFCK